MIPLPILVLATREIGCLLLPIVNGDAEAATTTSTAAPTGWTQTLGNLRARAAEAGRPHPTLGGADIFDGGTSADSRARQEIDLVAAGADTSKIDAGQYVLEVNWLGGTFIQGPDDRPCLRYYFTRTSGGSAICRLTSGGKVVSTAYGSMRWDQYTDRFRVPPFTRYLTIEMYAIRLSGSNNDASFDNIVPELCVENVTSGNDPYWDFVRFLSGFEGADGSTTIVDEADGRTITVSGNAQIDTAQFKYGSSSLLLDGTGDTFNTAADNDTVTNQPTFQLESFDWTMEGFFRFNAAPGASATYLMSQYVPTGNLRSWFLGATSTALQFTYSTNGSTTSSLTASWTPTTGVWYHVEVCRIDTTIYMFVDGVLLATHTGFTASLNVNTAGFRVGGAGAGAANPFLNGWADEVRLTVGVGRHSATFTPPAAAHPRS